MTATRSARCAVDNRWAITSVVQQDVRVDKGGAREGQQLPLPSGQSAAAFADVAVEPVRKAGNDGLCADEPRDGGQGQDRTVDLPLFRRTLVPTELPGLAGRFPGPAECSAERNGAVLTGFEPATSALTGRRALQTALQDLVTRAKPSGAPDDSRRHSTGPLPQPLIPAEIPRQPVERVVPVGDEAAEKRLRHL